MARQAHPPTEFEQRLITIASEHGFDLTRDPVMYYFELERDGVTVYLDRQRSKRQVIAVFLHPGTAIDRLHAINGLDVPVRTVHAAGMSRFPKKINKGTSPSSYGYSVVCADLTSYGRLFEVLPE
ncbi:hypothetical protein [Herbidospora daliensis]|uniref:hypothetical protein n=1 Tax=Herbidospora daliensis TaxID=295585 RepID=UPI0007820588|nr:hypothetical protein [Herbidospora daliensis]